MSARCRDSGPSAPSVGKHVEVKLGNASEVRNTEMTVGTAVIRVLLPNNKCDRGCWTLCVIN
jgi:hypothetical protein